MAFEFIIRKIFIAPVFYVSVDSQYEFLIDLSTIVLFKFVLFVDSEMNADFDVIEMKLLSARNV